MNVQPPQFDAALQRAQVQSTGVQAAAPGALQATAHAADAEGTRTHSDRATSGDRYTPSRTERAPGDGSVSDDSAAAGDASPTRQLVWAGIPELMLGVLARWLTRVLATAAWLLIVEWQLSFFSRSSPASGAVLGMIDNLLRLGWYGLALTSIIITVLGIASGLEITGGPTKTHAAAKTP